MLGFSFAAPTGKTVLAITLIENFRAVFYTPFYAALSLDAFQAEGLDVEIRMSPDPAATLQQLSASANAVSWGGPMRLLRAHDQDPGSTTVGFCEAIGRDPFFLIGRTPNPGYRPRDLIGKRVAVVSEVPTPWICLRQDLRLAGTDPAAVSLASPRTMGENAASLRRGELDVIQVFHPYARQLIDEGTGHLWYSAASRGLAAYTTLNTTREFIDRHPDTVIRMTRAMYRTQRWIDTHDGTALAQKVATWFPDLPEAMLAACCTEYKALGLWNRTPLMAQEGFDWLRDAMQASGDIGRRIAFEECIDMRFASRLLAEPVVDL